MGPLCVALALGVCAGGGADDRPQLAVWSARGQIVLVRADGDVVRRLAGPGRAPAPGLFARASWSPDGRRIAYAGRSGPARRDVYVARVDGSGSRRLTSDGVSSRPVWATDGRHLHFAREQGESTEIWSMRADGADQRRVTAPGEGRHDLPSSFAPHGPLLAFTRVRDVPPAAEGRERDRYEMWLSRPDGSDQRLVGLGRDPVFAPDGRRIAFASDRDRNGQLSYGDRVFAANELYVMRADGSAQRRITRTRDVNELAPSWSPGGRRLAYQAGRAFQNAEATAVMQANVDGTCARPVFVDTRRWSAAPAWRPRVARSGDGRLRCD